MPKVFLVLFLLVFFCFCWLCFSKESFENTESSPSILKAFLEKMKTQFPELNFQKKDVYNSDLCFVRFVSPKDKEEALFSVFLKKRYALLEKTWFVNDGFITQHQDQLRFIEF